MTIFQDFARSSTAEQKAQVSNWLIQMNVSDLRCASARKKHFIIATKMCSLNLIGTSVRSATKINKRKREKALRQRRKQRLTLTIINVIFIFFVFFLWNLQHSPRPTIHTKQEHTNHCHSSSFWREIIYYYFLSLSDDINSNDEYVFHCYQNREYKLVHLGHRCILHHHFRIDSWLLSPK